MTAAPGIAIPVRRHRQRSAVALSYAAFVLIGVAAGVGGVLLPAQMHDYGVSKAAIGISFFMFSAGFMVSGATTGLVLHRIGLRVGITAGCGIFVVAWLATAARPWFPAFLALQALAGLGLGTVESALNVYLSGLPGATTLLNRLHAFFGVGALLGPQVGTWLLGWWAWTAVWLTLALASMPLLCGFLVVLPDSEGADQVAAAAGPGTSHEAPGTSKASSGTGGAMLTALRQPAVIAGAVFLAIYVGLEASVGNWGFSFLMEDRGQSDRFAGYVVSGYWLGLTIGRFVISPIADRLGLTDLGMSFGCLVCLALSTAMGWLVPVSAVAVVAFAMVGFFLGPLFPTTMAVVPRMTPAPLVPTTISLLNGVSVVGGAVLPWLAGFLAQSVGTGTLLPYTLVLAVLLLAIWWRMTERINAAEVR